MDPHDGFHEFVDSHGPALSQVRILLTGDHQAAEDLLQTALTRCVPHWRSRHARRPRGVRAPGNDQ